MLSVPSTVFFFFFNDTATTEIYTLSLHDALPILVDARHPGESFERARLVDVELVRCDLSGCDFSESVWQRVKRSEEHTSELQSLTNLVCRLLLEKKKTR